MQPPARILVVEDEPLIAMMVEDLLDMLGYVVAGTVDSVEAALAAVDAGDVDGAISDVNLRGGEKSWPVLEAMRARGIPFVLSSGGSGDAVPAALADAPMLAKPYTMDGLRDVMAALPERAAS